MKRNVPVACIFAHPDDEAFGPGGTIALLAQKHDVYLLCATRGQAGKHFNPAKQAKLEKIRTAELKKSAAILGIKKIYLLGFEDGTLCNNLYHKLANKIEGHLKRVKPQQIITYEPRGVSGHIDHIVVSLVTTYVFYRLKFIKKLWYFCLDRRRERRPDDYFIYFPPGYSDDEINLRVDVSKVWDIKIKAMYAHHSQLDDIKMILNRTAKLPKLEHYITIQKQ